MDYPIYERIDYKGYEIVIEYDENGQNPFTEWDTLGTMYQNRRGCSVQGKYWRSLAEFDNGRGDISWDRFERDYIWSKVWVYSHGGDTISMCDENPYSCPFDSDLYGIIAVSKERVREEYGWKRITKARREKILSYLEGEVETLDKLLCGEVFGYTVNGPEDENGDREEDLDSCWGFYGDDFDKNGLFDYAKNFIDYKVGETHSSVTSAA